jgi:hypothetical protein
MKWQSFKSGVEMFPSKRKVSDVSSSFSVFIREAKSRDKKRVYKEVINDSIREQSYLIKRSRTDAGSAPEK